jgi:GNAT superfamily N-acetyltransferase
LVLPLLKKFFVTTSLIKIPLSPVYDEEPIILDPKIGIILVARDNEKIIGMINLLFTESTALGSKVAILEDMVVLSKFRGEGIGSQLIDYAIYEAKKEGCKRITLLTDIGNTKAQSFYQKNGFVKSKMTPYRLLLD